MVSSGPPPKFHGDRDILALLAAFGRLRSLARLV